MTMHSSPHFTDVNGAARASAPTDEPAASRAPSAREGLSSAMELRWSATISLANQPPGMDLDGASGHADVAVVVAVEPVDHQHVILEAWLELPRRRQTLLSRRTRRGQWIHDGRLAHLDVTDDGVHILRATVADEDRLMFAATDLLAKVGFGPGTADPPALRRSMAGRVIASA